MSCPIAEMSENSSTNQSRYKDYSRIQWIHKCGQTNPLYKRVILDLRSPNPPAVTLSLSDVTESASSPDNRSQGLPKLFNGWPNFKVILDFCKNRQRFSSKPKMSNAWAARVNSARNNSFSSSNSDHSRLAKDYFKFDGLFSYYPFKIGVIFVFSLHLKKAVEIR